MFAFESPDEIVEFLNKHTAPSLLNIDIPFIDIFIDKARQFADHTILPALQNKVSPLTADDFERYIKVLHGLMTKISLEKTPGFSGNYLSTGVPDFIHGKHMYKLIAECFSGESEATKMADALCSKAKEHESPIEIETARNFFSVFIKVFNNKEIELREAQKTILEKHAYPPAIRQGARAYEKLAIAYWENKLSAEEKQAVEAILKFRPDPFIIAEQMKQFAKEIVTGFNACDTTNWGSYSEFMMSLNQIITIRPFYDKNIPVAEVLLSTFYAAAKQSDTPNDREKAVAAVRAENRRELFFRARKQLSDVYDEILKLSPDYELQSIMKAGNDLAGSEQSLHYVMRQGTLNTDGIDKLPTPLERLLFLQLCVYNCVAESTLSDLKSRKALCKTGKFPGSKPVERGEKSPEDVAGRNKGMCIIS